MISLLLLGSAFGRKRQPWDFGSWEQRFPHCLRSCCDLAAGLVVPAVLVTQTQTQTQLSLHPLRAEDSPRSCPGFIQRVPALLCPALLGLVSCWEILQEPRVKGAVCCLGWVPTLALLCCFSCREGGEEAGQGKVENLWGLLPCGIFSKQHGLGLAPPGRAGTKPSKDFPLKEETQGRLVTLPFLEPGKGGISPLRTTDATGSRSLKKQLF